MLVPTRGRVIVENIPDTKQLPSGLFIAESVKEVPHRGRVIAIGLPYRDDKGREKEWHFREGEVVHFKRKWDQNKADLFILNREDIFAVESVAGGFRAVMDMVIIKRFYTKKIGTGIIELPDTYGGVQNNSDFYGTVVAEGPESRFNFKYGDKIIYHRDEGLSFKYEGYEYFSLKPRAVLAKMED